MKIGAKPAARPNAKLGMAGWLIVLIAFALGIWSSPAMSQGSDRTRAADDPRISYTVKRNDTLIGLSAKFFRKADDWREVQTINRIARPTRLPIGRPIMVPIRLLRSTPVTLQIDSFTGPVRVEGSGGARTASTGLAVPEGNTIRTGPGGFVTLTATGGDIVTLPSQTSVQLVRARRYLINDRLDVLFALTKGRATFAPTPKRDGDNWRVRTPVAVTAVRGTTFRIFHDETDTRSGTEVVEGTVGLTGEGDTADAARPLDAGFGNVATPAGLLPVEELLPPPAIIDPGRTQADADVRFAIAPLADADGYRVEIARDAGFLEAVAQEVTDRPEATFDSIASGTYFVRARGIAESGLEGLSEAYSFRRQLVSASVDEDPLSGGFKFAWRQSGGENEVYDFRLWEEDAPDRPLVAELGMIDRQIVLTDLPPAVYFWQVTVLEPGPDGIESATGSAQKLTVSP